MGRLGERIGSLEAVMVAVRDWSDRAADASSSAVAASVCSATRLAAVVDVIGGALAFILSVTIKGPKIGTTAVVGLLIAGQLAAATAIDRFGWFGFDRSGSTGRACSGSLCSRRAPRSRSGGERQGVDGRTVYLIWGSTYLGIKVAGDTIPAFFAVSTRFILAGSLMAVWVAWRRERGALRVTRRGSPPRR